MNSTKKMGGVSKYVKRLKRKYHQDYIYLVEKYPTAEDLAELVYYLLKYPNAIDSINLALNNLEDYEGTQLFPYLTKSSKIYTLILAHNQLGEPTYLDIADALRYNSSLTVLRMFSNQLCEQSRVDVAFVNALRCNPGRSPKSNWELYSHEQNEFERLNRAAEKSKSPSMLEFLLYVHSDPGVLETKKTLKGDYQ